MAAHDALLKCWLMETEGCQDGQVSTYSDLIKHLIERHVVLLYADCNILALEHNLEANWALHGDHLDTVPFIIERDKRYFVCVASKVRLRWESFVDYFTQITIFHDYTELEEQPRASIKFIVNDIIVKSWIGVLPRVGRSTADVYLLNSGLIIKDLGYNPPPGCIQIVFDFYP